MARESLIWETGTLEALPESVTGVRWPDGTVECRFRILHPRGSLVAREGDIGLLLTAVELECTTCSDACAN